MHESWQDKLRPVRQLALNANRKAIQDQKAGNEIYPHVADRFNAFNMPFDSVKVVIIGQDPYHGPSQANGLAFSVNKGIKIPPSLVNIYKELHSDLDITVPSHGDLSAWVDQGVLLLNTSLTVRRGEANSHKDYGWHDFIKGTLEIVAKEKKDAVWICWGKHAQDTAPGNVKYLIKSPHPSPFSADRGFFGSRPFSTCNNYLVASKQTPINWQL
jgi:uracil-DNA glycosylase